MNTFSEKAAATILKLIYEAPDIKAFNKSFDAALSLLKVSKTEIAKAVFNLLKSGKDLPETSEQALKVLTYMPIPLLRKEGVFNKLLEVMTPQDKKKIPTPTTVWGGQKYVRSSSHEITAGVLDFPRKRLPDSVFTYDDEHPLPKLRRDLRSLILAEARNKLAFFGAELIGANLYGGASGYQYNEGADIDVALYIDWEDFKGKHEILEAAFKTIEIPWGGFVIHLFVKPPHQREQIEVADAVYDILHDEWKIPPLLLPKGFDPNVFFQPIIELAEIKAQEIDVQMGIVTREWSKLKKAIQARAGEPQDPDVVDRRIEKQKQIIQDEVDELCRLFGDVWDGRLQLHDALRKKYVENRDVDRYERLQYPEIVWKYLDQAGYVEFLKVLIKANKQGVIRHLLTEI